MCYQKEEKKGRKYQLFGMTLMKLKFLEWEKRKYGKDKLSFALGGGLAQSPP